MNPATEVSLGRPRKYGNEETENLSFRVPKSIWDDLGGRAPSPGAAAFDVLRFEQQLNEALEPVLAELRISAALLGDSYDLNRAGTLARLVKQGLAAEKKSKGR